VRIALADGRQFERHETSGMLETGALEDKFTRLTHAVLGGHAASLYARLQHLEDEPNLAWLGTLD
jgi:hypothetical protein